MIVIEAPKDRVEEIRAVVLEAMTSERLQENVLGGFPSKQMLRSPVTGVKLTDGLPFPWPRLWRNRGRHRAGSLHTP